MGAFTLSKTEHPLINLEAQKKVFQKKGFIHAPDEFDIGDYHLLYFSKIKIGEKSILKQGNELLIGVGTFVYEQKYGKKALTEIYKSIKDGQFDIRQVAGDFLLLLYDERGMFHFFPVPGYTYNVFYDEDERLISSSFLAILEGMDRQFTVNRHAVVELLLTGNLIGPDTMLKEISRLECISIFKTGNFIHHWIKPESETIFEKGRTTKGFDAAVKKQLDFLQHYFQNTKPFIQQKGLCLGLTGGFDSRLLLGAALSVGISPRIYSTWRAQNREEFTHAKNVAEKSGLFLNYRPHVSWQEMDEESFFDLIDENFWFNDGLIRTHQLWTEEIKTRRYLNGITGDFQINSSGVGGEQYRNNARIRTQKRHAFKPWLTYEVLLKHNDNPFNHKKDLATFLVYMEAKIKALLDLDFSGGIDYLGIKRYYNEIYNPANRTVRNNIENQLHYFLSTFTDFIVSQKAYAAIPWLGADFEFEAAMINRISPELGQIATDYGFTLLQKIPRKQRWLTHFKATVPPVIFWHVYRAKKRGATRWEQPNRKFSGVDRLADSINALSLPIDPAVIMKSSYLAPLVLELGWFLNKYERKLL